jgi:hypothetical protein
MLFAKSSLTKILKSFFVFLEPHPSSLNRLEYDLHDGYVKIDYKYKFWCNAIKLNMIGQKLG